MLSGSFERLQGIALQLLEGALGWWIDQSIMERYAIFQEGPRRGTGSFDIFWQRVGDYVALCAVGALP
jgi:hypothetical protein